MKSILFILNPISGTVRKENIAKLIEHHIRKDLFSFEIRYTEYAGHAEEIAREAAQNHIDVVVAVGGDGTVNEVARGIVQTDTALAIVPCGSGNGLARHLMLPMNAKQAIELINEMVVHSLDYGVVDNHPFLCTCGVGFDAFIAEKFASAGKRGMMTYVEKILTDGLTYEPEHYEFSIDDEPVVSQDAWLISCANASQYGNNAYIAPHASMRDGVLDIVVMEPFNLLNAVSVNMEMINKTLDKNSKINIYRGKKMTIKRQNAGFIHFDGEPVMAPATVEVYLVEKGINVVVNAHADKKKRRPNMFQLALSEFFYDLDSLHRSIVETGKMIQHDIAEKSNTLQSNIVETGKTLQSNIVETGKNIQRLNQDILNKLTGNNK
ncbi:MAG: diacylglycerol kinase family lipid kinase [Bacteroidaceae bacterium]|nr:diacylglycerol kinase family lipid kinase [Bacteroidaceae bacterium]